MPLPTKYRVTDGAAGWRRAIDHARANPDPDAAEHLIDQAVDYVTRTWPTLGKRPGVCWSGGKDSLALAIVTERAGLHRGVLGSTNVDFPAMRAWLTARRPPGITELCQTNLDLHYLAANPQMLFPSDHKLIYRWAVVGHQRSQNQWARAEHADLLIFGRRRADGNFVGRGADHFTRKDGVTIWSPIADWTHEQVLNVLAVHDGIQLPPIYEWSRAFEWTTPRWPNRTPPDDLHSAWNEIWNIDADIVREAAPILESAQQFMHQEALT